MRKVVTRQHETARVSNGLLRPATVRGDVRAMQRAIADGEDVDGVDEDGWTVPRPAAPPPVGCSLALPAVARLSLV